jgi:carbamoyl-phosphate synthase/aspartate carbamoyltransferase/dihydroorotase
LQEGIFEKYGVRILGTPIKSIIDSEDRKLFAERIAEIGEQVMSHKFSRIFHTFD